MSHHQGETTGAPAQTRGSNQVIVGGAGATTPRHAHLAGQQQPQHTAHRSTHPMRSPNLALKLTGRVGSGCDAARDS
jgi:hypothetical protein